LRQFETGFKLQLIRAILWDASHAPEKYARIGQKQYFANYKLGFEYDII
jgi:hypothetical protein